MRGCGTLTMSSWVWRKAASSGGHVAVGRALALAVLGSLYLWAQAGTFCVMCSLSVTPTAVAWLSLLQKHLLYTASMHRVGRHVANLLFERVSLKTEHVAHKVKQHKYIQPPVQLTHSYLPGGHSDGRITACSSKFGWSFIDGSSWVAQLS